MSDKIFIQIPSYRDTQLLSTLKDLVNKSSNVSRLKIVVAWQYDKREERLEPLLRQCPNIELIKIPAANSLGCNWARSLLQQKWEGEKYTLLLDSHHRFVQRWDERVIDMYEKLKLQNIQKPVITGYLPPYDPLIDPEGRRENNLRIHLLERKNGLMFRLVGKEMPGWNLLETPIPAHFVSLHFLFTEGQFNKEIEFDPSIYFFADEVAIALRAYTFGYNLFHPHLILGWHLYNRDTRVTHWADHTSWRKQNEESCRKLSKLYRGHISGKYGTGLQRSISDYEEYIGMKLFHTAR